MRIVKLAALIALLVTGAAAQFSQVPFPATPPPFFGMSWQNNAQFPMVNSAAYRFHDTSTDWNQLASCDGGTNPTNGCYNWGALDTLITKFQAAPAAEMLYTFNATPGYANGSTGAAMPPTDINCDGTGTDTHFKNFVTAITAHVGTSIKYWEMWNEMDFVNYYDNTTINNTLCPTTANASGKIMARMAADARTIILAANPAAIIESPSISNTPGANGSGNGWNRFFQAGGGASVDRIAVHIGGANSAQICANPTSDPPTLENVVSALHQVDLAMTSFGITKPIEVTEGQWSANNNCVDPDFQTWFMAQTYPWLVSQGYTRFYFYAWNVSQVYLATVRNGATLSRSGTAYGVLQTWLDGNVPTAQCTLVSGIRACDYTRASPTGYQSEVIWNTTGFCGYNGTCPSSPTVVSTKWTKYTTIDGVVSAIVNNTVPVGAMPILLEATGSGSGGVVAGGTQVGGGTQAGGGTIAGGVITLPQASGIQPVQIGYHVNTSGHFANMQALFPQTETGAGNFRFWDSTIPGQNTAMNGVCPNASGSVSGQSVSLFESRCTWTSIETYLGLLKAASIQHFNIPFGHIPGWANGNQADTHPPTNVQDMGNYALALRAHIRTWAAANAGSADYFKMTWECWNEPNSGTFWYDSLGTAAGRTNLAQVCQAIYNSIKGVGNDVVLTPAMQGCAPSKTTGAAGVLNNYLLAAQALGGLFADGIAYHDYCGSNIIQVGGLPVAAPEANNTTMQSYVDLGNTFWPTNGSCSSLPCVDLYNTEWTWDNGSDSLLCDQNEEAAFLSRSLVLQFWKQQRLQYSIYYEVDNTSNGTLWTATSGGTCSTFPAGIHQAGIAFNNGRKWLLQHTVTGCSTTGTVWDCTLTGNGGYIAHWVWDTSTTGTFSNYTTPFSGFKSQSWVTTARTAVANGATVALEHRAQLIENQ